MSLALYGGSNKLESVSRKISFSPITVEKRKALTTRYTRE